MGNSGNNLLIGFLVFSVLFFAVALLVGPDDAFDSDVDAADSLATSASGTARGDPFTLESRQLRLVSTVWSPFTNAPGQPRFALNLVDEAFRRVGLSAETVIVDEAKFTSALLSGEFDGSAAVWKYAEREPVLIYSQPYVWNRLILVGRQGSDVSATSLADLAGKRIALVAGYVYYDRPSRGSLSCHIPFFCGPLGVDSRNLPGIWHSRENRFNRFVIPAIRATRV